MMRTTAILLAVFCIFTIPVAGQTEEAARMFDEANSHYRNGDFEAARTLYEDARKSGFESAALYQNLGSAYFRLDKLGLAMVNYQRAARLQPGNETIEHNIRIVQQRSRDRFSQVPTPVLSKWWNGFVNRLGLRTMFWLGTILWICGTAMGGYRLWHRSDASWLGRASFGGVIVGLSLIGSALATSAARSTVAVGVVVADRAEVRDEPSSGARTTVAVHEALIVEVLDQQNGWAEIRLPNGVTGYVRSESVGII